MKVTTEYHESEITVVRTITDLTLDSEYGSGIRASCDGEVKCDCCGRSAGTSIYNVDASWFFPVL